MASIVDTFKQEQFKYFNGYLSVPIFEAPKNHSSYHDSTVDEQIVITLPDDETDQQIHPPKNT